MKKLKNYRLTINWSDSKSITVSKDFATPGESRKWRDNCLAICGRNEFGTKYHSHTISQVDL